MLAFSLFQDKGQSTWATYQSVWRRRWCNSSCSRHLLTEFGNFNQGVARSWRL